MKKTVVHIPHQPMLDYSSKVVFLGSCFSENLSKKMKESGFSAETNPFGVIFNPISIANLVLSSEEEIETSVFFKDDVALSWLANSTCFAYSKRELVADLIEKRRQLLTSFGNLDVLFVTFGTAWAYEHKSTGKLVANCHKVDNKEFEKRFLSLSEIEKTWSRLIKEIQSINNNKNFRIVFTLSPVRHTKDGLVENSRSKALLLTAIHNLVERFPQVEYFPTYELLIDELRDYAFYEKDGIHPNEIAIDKVWECFKETYFHSSALDVLKELEDLKKLLSHRPLHAESKESKSFELKKLEKMKAFETKYPFFKGKLRG